MQKKIIISCSFGLVAILILAAYLWTSSVEKAAQIAARAEKENAELLEAEIFLKNNDVESALQLIWKHTDQLSKKTEMGARWRDLFIVASSEANEVEPLLSLYQYFPEAFITHEKASFLVAKFFIEQGKIEDYSLLREVWRDMESKPSFWAMLDADKFILLGDTYQANELLRSFSLDDKEDSSRLIKLAYLNVYNDPKEAWDFLNKAYLRDPSNPDIRSYRGKLLEVTGNSPQALAEYLAAAQTDPTNPELKDQIANFYLRRGEYGLALKEWSQFLTSNSADYIWLNALFWNRIITPLTFNWNEYPIPEGKWKPFIEYMLALPKGTFWDESLYNAMVNHQEDSQITFWLTLLQSLKDRNEKQALQILNNNFFANSWNSELTEVLKQILDYRLRGEKDPNLVFLDLIESKEIFSAELLASKWYEAGLNLHALSILPDNFPDMVAVNLTEALRINRSDEAALNFAENQKQTPPLTLLEGQILISLGQKDEGIHKLQSLAYKDSDLGYQAAWLLSLVYLDLGKYKDVKETIQNQPNLAREIIGKEILAKSALKAGKIEEAENLYFSIQSESLEAKSYFAKKAFMQKDYQKAKKLTEELMEKYSANPTLKENYEKILDEEKKIPILLQQPNYQETSLNKLKKLIHPQ